MAGHHVLHNISAQDFFFFPTEFLLISPQQQNWGIASAKNCGMERDKGRRTLLFSLFPSNNILYPLKTNVKSSKKFPTLILTSGYFVLKYVEEIPTE